MVARSDASPDNSADVVLLDIRNHIAHLTLNRPRVLNAINGAMRIRLTQALQELDQDPEVRVIVLGGAGRSFCAGNDLRESATAGRISPSSEPRSISPSTTRSGG
jgi:enoyl-CoA hydratase/carnithine racemase